jgi:SAM-dependent methyltransferase
MLAGVKLGVFTALGQGPRTASQLAADLRVSTARLTPLLNALLLAGLLQTKNGRFANTTESARWLVRGRPGYIEDDPRLNPLLLSWSLDAGLRTDESIRKGAPVFRYEFKEKPLEELVNDFRGTQTVAERAGRELVSRFPLCSSNRVADVGAGGAGLAISIQRACPDTAVTAIDLPGVAPVAKRFVEEAGLAGRVRIIGADAVEGPLSGEYDAVVLRAFLQVLDPERAARALRTVSGVLRPGGHCYVVGHLLDDSRLAPPDDVWWALSAIGFYDGPVPHTEGQLRDWMVEAGLEPAERVVLPNGDQVLRSIRRRP